MAGREIAWNILESFAESVATVCKHAVIAPDMALRWTIIANPTAGGFVIRRKWKAHAASLMHIAQHASAQPLRTQEASPSRIAQNIGIKNGLIATTGPGHARTITRAVLDEMFKTHQTFFLIITAGGDGTSLEVLHELYLAPEIARSHTVVLRLPMGTGNDGSDAWDVAHALSLLLSPAPLTKSRAVQLTTATARTFYAFNVLSVGLDAFVTHNTNAMKGNLPGDSYKLWVDIASLLYDKLYHVGVMDVEVFDESHKLIDSFSRSVLLLAVGATGYRTYGSHKWILPDERNVCVLNQMSLLRKLKLKEYFNTGMHVFEKESALFTAHTVRFRGRYPILAQMDGETTLLNPEDFPASISLTEALIPCFAERKIPHVKLESPHARDGLQ
ncbi:MAG: diacylglycerol kinase [Treponema sp.]|jgi:diacylglycerol kinase family enzyme|nr:diacylglycerol kinase [Treponema sp.]